MSVDLQVLRAQAKRAAEKTCAGCNYTHRLSDCPQAVTILRGRTVLALIDAVEALRVIAEGTIPDRLIPAGAGVIDGETVSINYTEPVSARQFARAALAAIEAPA